MPKNSIGNRFNKMKEIGLGFNVSYSIYIISVITKLYVDFN